MKVITCLWCIIVAFAITASCSHHSNEVYTEGPNNTMLRKGDIVPVFNDSTALYRAPSSYARVIMTISPPHQVEVLECAGKSVFYIDDNKVADFRDFWYKVANKIDGNIVKGYVWGGHLSKAQYSMDFDEDGKKEYLLFGLHDFYKGVCNENKEFIFALKYCDGKDNIVMSLPDAYAWEDNFNVKIKNCGQLYYGSAKAHIMRMDISEYGAYSDDHFLLSGIVHTGKNMGVYVLSSTEYEYGEPVTEYIDVDIRKNTLIASDIVERIVMLSDGGYKFLTATETKKFVYKGDRFDVVKEYQIPDL